MEYSAENIQTAKENVVEHISCPGQKDVRMLEYAWFGNIAELTFELGLSFIYELGDAEYPNCHRIFFASAFDENDESTFHESLLAKSIIHSPAIHIFHVRVLEAILRRSSLYTPKRLNDKLKELIEQFPHEVFFLKKLIDRSTPLNARVFLQKNPGDKGGLCAKIQ